MGDLKPFPLWARWSWSSKKLVQLRLVHPPSLFSERFKFGFVGPDLRGLPLADATEISAPVSTLGPALLQVMVTKNLVE